MPLSAISQLTIHKSCLPPSSVRLLPVTVSLLTNSTSLLSISSIQSQRYDYTEFTQTLAALPTQPAISNHPHSEINKSLVAKRTAAFWGGLQPTITLPTVWFIALFKPLTSPHSSLLFVAIFLPRELMITPWYFLNEKIRFVITSMSYIQTSMLLTAVSSHQWTIMTIVLNILCSVTAQLYFKGSFGKLTPKPILLFLHHVIYWADLTQPLSPCVNATDWTNAPPSLI